VAVLDVIEWIDQQGDEIVHRVPEYGSGEFRLGSQCVVRESQVAVFFRDGKALDMLPPGRHTLSTENIPILTRILSIPFGGRSPFRAEVVYVSMRQFLDIKWGTPQPIIYRDTDLGVVRLRSFGTYAMRVSDPQLFVNTIVGTQGVFRTEDISSYLRSIIVQQLTVIMGQVMKSVLDLAVMYEQLALATKTAVTDQFASYGLQLDSFQIGAITPPDEVQAKIDERSSMGVLGNLDQYLKYRTAQAIGDAANNPGEGGGAFSAGVGIGLGAQAASVMRDTMQQQQPAGGYQQQQPPQYQQPPPVPQYQQPAPPPGAPVAQAAGNAPTTGPKFCPNCGFGLTAMPDGGPPRFCPNCGNKLRD
jgi:membrane protease subunit (stomatin/prohibitin family)